MGELQSENWEAAKTTRIFWPTCSLMALPFAMERAALNGKSEIPISGDICVYPGGRHIWAPEVDRSRSVAATGRMETDKKGRRGLPILSYHDTNDKSDQQREREATR